MKSNIYSPTVSSIAEALELKSLGKEPLNGLGGIREANVYLIALGLPNGFMFHNLKVCSLPIDEYDVLIGTFADGRK